MNSCVTWPHGPGLLVYGAGWGEYVFVGLKQSERQSSRKVAWAHTETRRPLQSSPFHGSSVHRYSLCTRTWATDHQWAESAHWSTCSLCYNRWGGVANFKSITHSEFAQSRLAGQRRAPVHSWLKLRPNFTFHSMWGFRDWPLGIIQSMIALFIPLVLSALALLDPFWT